MANTPVEVKKPGTGFPSVPEHFRSLRNEMDRLFDRFAGGVGFPPFGRMFDLAPPWRGDGGFTASPAVEVSEDDKCYRITAELPGLSEKDVEVTISGDSLLIKGEKRQEREDKQKNYHFSERSYGSFQRAFTLPEGIERDKIDAEFSKGVLTITLPKSADAQKQKKIEVKAAG